MLKNCSNLRTIRSKLGTKSKALKLRISLEGIVLKIRNLYSSCGMLTEE